MAMLRLQRRGFDLGASPGDIHTDRDPDSNWQNGLPLRIKGICCKSIESCLDSISTTEKFVLKILDGHSSDEILPFEPYSISLKQRFNLVGSTYNEGDDQEIETIMFDRIHDGDVIAEDLWMKVSWLSFYEEDASLRFRFSFGIDLVEEVSADTVRQQASAELAEAIFPESQIITQNEALIESIQSLLNGKKPMFVERILYFNGPEGGAYLHHDLERGHAGVVYAQVTGSTCWLALPKSALVTEIKEFLKEDKLPESLNEEHKRSLDKIAQDPILISDALDSFNHDGLIHLINETKEFVQRLISKGYYRILHPGDVILLSQSARDMCCWHSVFCLGEEMGQALSFAIR